MRTTRGVTILLAVYLFASSAMFAAAESIETTSKKVMVYSKPDITIKMGDQTKSFYDAKGSVVFPIVYQGTTYLPVRAVSGLMGENIEWDEKSKTIFIGKTLKNPVKSEVLSSASVRNGNVPFEDKTPVQMVEAYVKPEFVVMYDFVVQRFSDVNGEDVCPLNYKGSVYLPVRAISKLMGENIEWDAGLKLITISDSKAEKAAREEQKSERVRLLKSTFEETLEIHAEATAKVSSLQEADSAEKLNVLAAYVSDDSQRADRMTTKIKEMDKTDFTREEMNAYNRLLAFAEASEYYILVLENITYMAASGQDYAVFAETFLNFAVDAQAKLELAGEAMKAL